MPTLPSSKAPRRAVCIQFFTSQPANLRRPPRSWTPTRTYTCTHPPLHWSTAQRVQRPVLKLKPRKGPSSRSLANRHANPAAGRKGVGANPVSLGSSAVRASLAALLLVGARVSTLYGSDEMISSGNDLVLGDICGVCSPSISVHSNFPQHSALFSLPSRIRRNPSIYELCTFPGVLELISKCSAQQETAPTAS